MMIGDDVISFLKSSSVSVHCVVDYGGLLTLMRITALDLGYKLQLHNYCGYSQCLQHG